MPTANGFVLSIVMLLLDARHLVSSHGSGVDGVAAPGRLRQQADVFINLSVFDGSSFEGTN